MTYTLFLILVLIIAALLILVIMVQNPKGGGLSSSLGGGSGQSIGSVQSTNEFLDKSTWTLAIVMIFLILASNFVIQRPGQGTVNSKIENTLDNRGELDEVPLSIPVDNIP